jgi:hypothetical protein
MREPVQRGKISGDSKIPSSAPQFLIGRNWLKRNGEFAPEAWVRSASRPYPFFRFAEICHSRVTPKRLRTAAGTPVFNHISHRGSFPGGYTR